MEIHSDYVEPAASALSYENVSFGKTNDSGYHTFTPGSLECAEISNELLDQSVITSDAVIPGITGQIQFGYFHVTPDVNIHSRRYTTHSNDSLLDTPPLRRACKRAHSSTTEKADSFTNSIPTPTSFIAGKIKSLDVNENKENSDNLSPVNSQCSDKIKRRLYQHDLDQIQSYPTTPVKKNCKRSPCKKSGKRPHFAIHSLSCESNELQSYRKVPSKAVKNINFWPDKKIDIVCSLYGEAGAVLPLMNILSYLSNEDINNFNLVSHAWRNIWNSVSSNNKLKKNYDEYMKTIKANKENRDKGVTPKSSDMKLTRIFREIHNEILEDPMKIKPRHSPPVSPRTYRFRKFTKAASLDSRGQLPCSRCKQPAKVTEETSGEVWVECTRISCQYKFCKYCGCDRHSGKFCFQYNLDVPSPTKRKRSQYAAIGTKKSRRNLMRL